MTTIIKGHIVHAPVFGALRCIENGYIVCEDGVIAGVYETLPPEYAAIPLTDHGDRLIIPSFCDMHLHAPQYAMLGLGMNMQLLEWLDAYTFPTEARFGDEAFARAVYRRLAGELVRVGTTRAVLFSSIHRAGTRILMEELQRAGVTGYVGKVNMDRNSPAGYCENTRESIAETERFIEECAGRYAHISPLLTPRFTPSCTDELLAALGGFARKYA
ncbi:MAG: amidohydrolase family protein, partial [Clostridiales bacterium]|nr:amidohydrolase family protein [Clostridiales bacterium]